MKSEPLLHIVDDDSSVRSSLTRLLRASGYHVEAFASADDYLSQEKTSQPSCLILDLRLPGLNGMDLQEELTKRGAPLSIIFISGHGDVRTSVRAMKNGAVDFLPKPFDDAELLSAVSRAVKKSKLQQQQRTEQSKINSLIEKLTPRENEVLGWMISGLLNKQIAFKLGIKEKTIKVHRAKVMEKMNVSSMAELVRLTEKAEVRPSARTAA